MLFRMMLFLKNLHKFRMWWVLFLSLALLCAQSVKLHVHDLDHTHTSSESVINHSHTSEFHLSVDVSHAEYHHQAMPEIDLGMSALLNNISAKMITLALLVTLIILCLHSLYPVSFSRRRRVAANAFSRYHFSPPLRAPPR